MRKLTCAVILTTGLLVSPGVWAAQKSKVPSTNQEYMAACESKGALFLYCAGTIKAIASMMADPFIIQDRFRACFPKGTTSGQRIQAYINWVKDNPKLWQEPGWSGMTIALFSNWSCPK